MDPLCDRLACDCVAGYAQRKYDRLGQFIEKRLRRKVAIAYAETLSSPQAGGANGIDLIAGKFSEVVFDADEAGLRLRTVAMLTGSQGTITQTGLFVVRHDDPAEEIEDLEGYRVLFGPEDALEKRDAALAALDAFGLPVPAKPLTSSSCSEAALAVVEKEADAAVISSYAMPLLEGCGTVDKGSLRIVGRTDPVPFIGVFATERIGRETEGKVAEALFEVGARPELTAALQSRDGFVRLSSAGDNGPEPAVGWNDWRGPRRDATSKQVPRRLPRVRRLLWQRTMTGPGISGLAVAARCIVVADKDLDDEKDIFRCLDADTGRQHWKLVYPAAPEMDYTNSPRANPVICDGLVYLLGAFGDLHCARLRSGEIVWKTNLAKDFGAKVPTWGYCPAPLVVDNKLIVHPGAKKASIVALDRFSGKVLWATPGEPPGYACPILAELGGVRQIVGYDAISLGGWDPQSGKRLWRLVPEFEGDFNVPTPVVVGQKLLVATENNGTRLYRFDANGRIDEKPVAVNEDLQPDTSTPVVLDQRVFASFGGLWCLALDDGLKTLWESDENPLADYCSFIAGNGRVLVTTQSGKLYLLDSGRREFAPVGTLDLFPDVPDSAREVWSHPALVGNRLYVRNMLGVYCFLIR